jgi:hypothetical protein
MYTSNKIIKVGMLLLIILPLLFAGISGYSQFDSLEHKYFNNDSIHYDVIYVSHSVLSKEPNHISKHYISLQMSKAYRDYLLERDTAFWLERLRNDNSDWATNLILYYLYDIDASRLIVFNVREKWIRIKEDDIKYWKKFLSASIKKSQSSTKKSRDRILGVFVSSEMILLAASFSTQI